MQQLFAATLLAVGMCAQGRAEHLAEARPPIAYLGRVEHAQRLRWHVQVVLQHGAGRAAEQQRCTQSNALAVLHDHDQILRLTRPADHESPSSTCACSGRSSIPDARACSTNNAAKSCSVNPCPMRDWICSRLIAASGIGTSNLRLSSSPRSISLRSSSGVNVTLKSRL